MRGARAFYRLVRWKLWQRRRARQLAERARCRLPDPQHSPQPAIGITVAEAVAALERFRKPPREWQSCPVCDCPWDVSAACCTGCGMTIEQVLARKHADANL